MNVEPKRPEVNPAPAQSSRRAVLARVLVWLVVLLVIGFGTTRIAFDVNPLRLLSPDLPEVRGLTAFADHFSRPDELILAVDGADPAEVAAFAGALAEHLRGRNDLTSAVIDAPPGEGDPAALAELVAYALVNQPPGHFAAFAAGLSEGASLPRIERTLEAMAFDPSPEVALLAGYDAFGLIPSAFGAEGQGLPGFGAPRFGSEDGRLRLLYLWAAQPFSREDYRQIIAWTTDVRDEIASWRKNAGMPDSVRVRLTGEPAIMAEVSGGMQRDLMRSGGATLAFVGGIFWLAYRRMRPLLALLAMLTLIFLTTLGIAGLVLRELTVMNIGFASILIGLSVDYGVLVYQHSLIHPGDSRAILRATRRGILCAGATTAAAFASLLASELPSLAELGAIVCIGILVGSGGMLAAFVPWMSRMTRDPDPDAPAFVRWPLVTGTGRIGVAALVALATVASAGLLWHRGMPPIDASERSTRPRVSEAYDALDEVIAVMTGGDRAGSFVLHAPDGLRLRDDLAALEDRLARSVEQGKLRSYSVPTALVPAPSHQEENLGRAEDLLRSAGRLTAELEEAGFAPEASALLQAVFDRWETWRTAGRLARPEQNGTRWLLERLTTTEAEGEVWAAAHFVPPDARTGELGDLQTDRVFLADWDETMAAMAREVPRDMGRILVALLALVLLMLVITFRRWQEILWVILGLGLSLVLVLGGMRLFGWTWNFYNLAAILLCVGAGLDYSVHMLLAMTRGETTAPTAQALLVCSLTSVAGFGSLAWASNLGLASLGQVCALALASNALVSIFLLPTLHSLCGKRSP